MSRYVRLLALGLLLLSQVAAAGEDRPPGVVIAPVDVDPHERLERPVDPNNPKESKPTVADAMRRMIFDIFRDKAGVALAGRDEVPRYVKRIERSDFRKSNEALRLLAIESKADFAVYVAVTMDAAPTEVSPKLVDWLGLSARVVREFDGKEVAATSVRSTVGKNDLLGLLRVLVHELVRKLDLKSLPAAAPADAVAAPTPPPPPPPPGEVQKVVVVPQPADPGAEQRFWGKVGVGAGVGVGAIGGILWSLAPSDFARVNVVPDGTGNLVGREDALTRQAGRTKQAAGIALVAGGVVIAGVGAALWALAPKAPSPVTIGAVPLQDGFALSIGGALK